MYDDEEDQQNSERSDNPDEIGSDPSVLVLSPQKVHTGWRTVVVPWQDQSLSLEFFGVPLPPTPTTAIRIEPFSFFYLGRPIRFRLLSHIPESTLTLSPPINFLSLRNVSRLDLGRIDMPFDFGILRNLPCLTRLTFLPLSRPEPMSQIDVSHIIPRSHIHARKPYFPSHEHAMKPYVPPLTHSLRLFCLCGFFVCVFLFFGFGIAKFLLDFLIFWFFYFFWNYLAQHVCLVRGKAAGAKLRCQLLDDIDKFLCDDDFEIGGDDECLCDDDFEIGGDDECLCDDDFEIGGDDECLCDDDFEICGVLVRGHSWCYSGDDFELCGDSDDDFEIGDDIDKLCNNDFEIGGDFEILDDIEKFLCDDDIEIGDLSENVGSPNDLICLSPTTETLEGRIERTWPEYQSANPALEQHRAILPRTVPHVMTRNNAASELEVFLASLRSPQCLSGSITQDNLAQSCPLVTMKGFFPEGERYIDIMNSSIELPCSDPALKLPTVTTAQGSVEEERYVKIINPSMELYSRPQCIKIPQLAGPALRPEAFPNVGKIMQLDSSEQESSVRFDATNIGGNVVSANKNCTTTCSQKKITIAELLPLIGLPRKVAAGKIGVSIPTFKRVCRPNKIDRWPDHRNKRQCDSLKQKLATDSDQGAAGAFGHFVTGSHTGAVGSNHHKSPCSKPPKRQREKKASPSCKTPSTVATCSDPAPIAMSTFPQIMPHLRAGQDARIEILKTTEDIPIQSVQGVTTRSCLSPQKRADVPSTSSPKHFHCLATMNGCFLEEERSIELEALPCIQMSQSATFSFNPTTSSHTNVVGSNYQNARGSKPSKSRREKKMSPSCKKPSIGGQTEIVDQMLESSHSAPKGQPQEQNRFHLQKQNAGTAIIKAKYGNKTVIVPPPATSGIVKLKEELARRLELEHGSFYVEYEDMDHDWILIACDDALQECLTSSTSRDNQVIRLSVRDEVVNSQ